MKQADKIKKSLTEIEWSRKRIKKLEEKDSDRKHQLSRLRGGLLIMGWVMFLIGFMFITLWDKIASVLLLQHEPGLGYFQIAGTGFNMWLGFLFLTLGSLCSPSEKENLCPKV